MTKPRFPPDPDLSGMTRTAKEFFDATQFREAFELCTYVLEQEPGDPQAHWLAGRSLVELGRADEAIPHLEKAARAYPKEGLPLVDLGHALDRAGRLQDALSVLADAAARTPELAAAWYEHGSVAQRLGEYSTSVKSLNECLRLRPGYGKALMLRGFSLYGLGNDAAALKDLRAALDSSPHLRERIERVMKGRLEL